MNQAGVFPDMAQSIVSSLPVDATRRISQREKNRPASRRSTIKLFNKLEVDDALKEAGPAPLVSL